MIEYIGNYANLIPENWNEFVLQNQGEVRPNEKIVMTPDVRKQFKVWNDAGYLDNPCVQWELFTGYYIGEELDVFSFDFCKNKNVDWWIVKLQPGRFFPMHRDTIKEDQKNFKRYWIAMDNYKWGHVFIDNSNVLRDYKRGDVFLFDNDLHGAVNVGLESKISLQILTWD